MQLGAAKAAPFLWIAFSGFSIRLSPISLGECYKAYE